MDAGEPSPVVIRLKVRPTGFEPVTLGSEDRCAIQLRHGRVGEGSAYGFPPASTSGGRRFGKPSLEPCGVACYKRRLPWPPRQGKLVACPLLLPDLTTMALITLRVLDGADRGRVYEELSTPVTIGREEGNSLQLNDERVSRFHVKIQEDQDKIVVTDLESTNGTKVNGEDIQLRILRFGDIISLGRSVLLFGSREQIAGRLAALRGELSGTQGQDDPFQVGQAGSLDFELSWSADPDIQSTLHTLQVPDLPERLGPGQAAQLCELLEYLHIRIRDLLNSVTIKPDADRVTLEARQWQNLVDLQSRLATYLRSIGQPHEEE
jgi:pSer/pThr/pTyr-binding forkhead associated (FHA) protein